MTQIDNAAMAGASYRKSMFGLQANSELPSAPAYGFGTEERPAPAALEKGGKISPGPVYNPLTGAGGVRRAPSHSFGVSHRYTLSSQKQSGTPVPGPGAYMHMESVGKQSDSQKHSYSTWKMGTSTRGDQAKVFISPEYAKAVPEFISSPGPCAYQHIGSLGGQADSRKPTNPLIGLGTSERFFYGSKDPRETGTPSPVAYKLHPAVGLQVSSMKPSYPVNSFPKADRDRTAKAEFLSKSLAEKAANPKASPGPAIYTLKNSVGKQASSVKPNCPQFGFGTCDRFNYQQIVGKGTQTPGPGSYSL